MVEYQYEYAATENCILLLVVCTNKANQLYNDAKESDAVPSIVRGIVKMLMSSVTRIHL